MPLYIVGTPIGNLGDITLRALETLRSADVIAAEDTRVTRKLLAHFHISKPLISYREEVHHRAAKKILDILREDKSVAFVTDAGTPGISDPGARLVREVRDAGFEAIPIPGASALTALLSASGVYADQFVFVGFPPSKKKRKRYFETLAHYKCSIVLYESPHRLLKTLLELGEAFGGDHSIIIGRELTKMHEEIVRGTIHEIIKRFGETKKESLRGEFVLLIERII